MGFVERRDGRYRARYRDPLGKQRCETFTRKADAERFLREQQVEIERGRWLDPRAAEVPLAEWAEEFLALARRLSPTTQETYRRDLTKYVLPRFGAYRLGRLPADEIENWLNDEVAAGIAPSSVHRHYRVLRRVLQVAVEKQKLHANPCDRVQPPRVPKRDMAFLTWEESVALAEAIHERYRALIYLAVDSGMRWSEIVGLRRARLDVRRGKVRVTEQLVRLEAGEWLRKEPKTSASVRSITLSPFTADLLAEHLDRFSLAGPDGLVFVNRVGNPLISSSFWQHYFQPALGRAGVSRRVASTTCATRALPSPSPKARTRRLSRPAWATRRSTSPSTGTGTSFRSWMRPSPSRSANASRQRLWRVRSLWSGEASAREVRSGKSQTRSGVRRTVGCRRGLELVSWQRPTRMTMT
jgi:integrase